MGVPKLLTSSFHYFTVILNCTQFKIQFIPETNSQNRVIPEKRTLVRVRVTLRLTVSQPVSLGVDPLLGLMTRFLALLIDYLVFILLGAALSDERVGLSFVEVFVV
jgi:hypothetical protein